VSLANCLTILPSAPRFSPPSKLPAYTRAEVAIEDSKQLFGAGQARNRITSAVERTVPFGIACQAAAVTWYATAGHHPATVDERRRDAPWYTTKSEPSTSDMTALLRRVLMAARFKAPRPGQPTCEEIHAIRLAWEDVAA
jgi:hypothetical protein